MASDSKSKGKREYITLISDEKKNYSIPKETLLSESRVFNRQFSHLYQESAEGVIRISEFDPVTIDCMVKFFCQGDYSLDRICQHPEHTTPASTGDVLLCHIKVNIIADYYEIDNLRQLANKYIEEAVPDWKFEGISSIVKEFHKTYDRTPSDLIASAIAKRPKQALKVGESEFNDAMSYIAVPVVEHMIQLRETAERDRKRAIEEVSQVQGLRLNYDFASESIEHLQAKVEDHEALLDKGRQEFDRLSNALGKICRSRACSTRFNCFLEAEDRSNFDYRLRCSKCRCRQWRS